jgi:K+-sensing histidine kinase KdpD
LRTPLGAIKGYSTMILDYYNRLSAAEKKEYLIAIDASTDRLTRLVENLLDTTRINAGLLKLDKVPTNIGELIKVAAREANGRDSRHHIVTDLSEPLPVVDIDVNRIRQVLDNLINNAAKYSPPGTEIVITARASGRELNIGVTDHGPGIPPDELGKIFGRMYRIEQRLGSNSHGVGLGLYICQELVQAHGGRIWAESTVGQGSTIQFTLPLMAGTKKKGGQSPAKRLKKVEA